MQQTMETVLFNKINTLAIIPLPPIMELSFLPQEIDSLKDTLNGKIDFNSNSILLLHKRVKTILVGGFMISAKGSQNSHSSFVLARWRTSTTGGAYTHHLAGIQYFVSCIVVSTDKKEKQIMWVAIVKWLMEHQCQVWFGYPTQVWSSTYYPGKYFILISDIKSRIVYSHHIVNFGNFIGGEKVYIVTPLEILH